MELAPYGLPLVANLINIVKVGLFVVFMARMLNEKTKERIIQYLDSGFGEPKRYSEIWRYCKLMSLFKTPKTLTLYLKRLMDDDKLVDKDENGKYFIRHSDKYKELKNAYETAMEHEFKFLGDTAYAIVRKIRMGDIPREKIENQVFNAWDVFRDKAVVCFDLMLEGKGKVSVVSDALTRDWVVKPFKLSSVVIFECFKKYPNETKQALRKLRVKTSG